jgi:hypothetical protein
MTILLWVGLFIVAAVVIYALWYTSQKESKQMTQKKQQQQQVAYDDPEKASIDFLRRGLDYYVAGRFSALPGRSLIVSGNIMHHAIEMLLKGALCKAQGHSQQQIRAMNHKLTKAWEAFKKAFRSDPPRLNRFDSAVKDLDKFEDLRYPDKLLSSGMFGSLILKRSHVAQTSHTDLRGYVVPEYRYVIEDVDELVKVIFEVGSINPQFFQVSDRALEILRENNDHPVLWRPE